MTNIKTSEKTCPKCESELTVMVEPNHPDPNDYPVGLYCENCHYQEDF